MAYWVRLSRRCGRGRMGAKTPQLARLWPGHDDHLDEWFGHRGLSPGGHVVLPPLIEEYAFQRTGAPAPALAEAC